MVPQRQILSFFIDHRLGVCAVRFVGADEDEIRVCGNAEASVAAFRFQLISQISGAIVQEFCGASIGKGVFLVEDAVLLTADALVLQGHTAALANKLAGKTQKRVDRHIEELGKNAFVC